MARALRPGGRLIVDHRDPAYDVTLPRRLWYRAGAHRFILEDRRFDRRTKITETTQLVITTGRRFIVQRSFRLQEFSLSEWRRLLRRAGLRLLRACSGYDGRRYRPGSTGRLIIVAERPLRLDRTRGPSESTEDITTHSFKRALRGRQGAHDAALEDHRQPPAP